MKNVYDGTVTTDGSGHAIVTLPDWFQALNSDFRYQLTTIGQPAHAWVTKQTAPTHLRHPAVSVALWRTP